MRAKKQLPFKFVYHLYTFDIEAPRHVQSSCRRSLLTGERVNCNLTVTGGQAATAAAAAAACQLGPGATMTVVSHW